VDVLLNAAPGVSAEQFVYRYQAPQQLPDGLATGAAPTHADTLFVDSLFSATGRGEFGRINALLVARDHELIGEMYFYGYQPGDLHPLESTTKSITSLLVGIAIEQGAIPPVNTQVVQWYPQLQRNSPIAAETLTLKHLLTMSSGFAPREQALFGSNNRIAFALNRPMDTLPGKVFRYDGGNTELLGGILKQSTGLFADEFAARYLFGPLQITDWNWEKHRQDGYPSMAGALHLRPRDMAKIGLLVLHNGMYNNQQVVEPHWIQASTTAQIATHIDGDEYGYQWWISHLHSGNSVYKTIWANGIGSQFIFVVPRLQLVVVCTGHNYQQDAWAFVNGLAQYLYLLK
jgi:CubicO group peptidase (beta-lactamase class C family)